MDSEQAVDPPVENPAMVEDAAPVAESHAMDIDPAEVKEEISATPVVSPNAAAPAPLNVQNLMTGSPALIKVPTSALPSLSANPTMSAIPRPASAGPVRLPPPNAYLPMNMGMSHSAPAPPQSYYPQAAGQVPHQPPPPAPAHPVHHPPQPHHPQPVQPNLPPASSSAAAASSNRMELQDAFAYLDRVKAEFSEQPDVYNRFLQIMREFKANT